MFSPTPHPVRSADAAIHDDDAGDDAAVTASPSFLRARARSLREQAARCIEPVAVAYRRRAAELEFLAAVRAGTVQLATVPVSSGPRRLRPQP